MLSEEESKSFIARTMCVHRKLIDRIIEQNPIARSLWEMRSE